MKKRVFLSACISLVFLLSLFACSGGSPTTPPPPPPQKKHFQVQFRYTRPAGSILQPDLVDREVGIVICANLDPSPGISLYELIDDYNFNWSKYYDIPENENEAIYPMHGLDAARYDGTDMSTTIVGERFFVRVKETGVETELTNVQPNTNACNVSPGPNAKMVQWRLNKDGSISQY